MKLIRILLTALCLATAVQMYPMNNPTGQKSTQGSQEFALKTKKGKRAALYALLNPQTLILLAHYKNEKGFKVDDLAKYAKEKAFLAHLIGLTDVINDYNAVLQSKPTQIKQQIQKPVAKIQQKSTKQESFFFEGDAEEFENILRVDSTTPAITPVASDTPSTQSSTTTLSPQTPPEPTAMAQHFGRYIQEQQLAHRSQSTPATMIVIKNPNERLAETLAHEANMLAFHKAQRTASFSNLQLDRSNINTQQLPTITEQNDPENTTPEPYVLEDNIAHLPFFFDTESEYKETNNNHRTLITLPSETLHNANTQKPIVLDQNALRFVQYLKEEQRTLPHSTSAPLLRTHVAPEELANNLRLINRGQFSGFNLEQPLFTQLPSETTEQKENANIQAFKAALVGAIGRGTKAAPTPRY